MTDRYATPADVLRKFDAQHIAELADPTAQCLLGGEVLQRRVGWRAAG